MNAPRLPHDHLQLSDVLIEEGEQLFSDSTQRFSQRVAEQRTALQATNPLSPSDAEQHTDDCKEAVARQAVYAALHSSPTAPTALCLSGGGIRSATFNLGVLQALASHSLLGRFDYLSTVSGGGYIGSWLTAWIHRMRKGNKGSLADVQAALAENGTPNQRRPGQIEPDPITWLRDHSNYLTPRLGLFSADSWTMVGIVLRNLLLNWLVLLPLLIGAFMVPRLQIAVVRQYVGDQAAWWLLWSGLLASLPTLTYLHLYRPVFTPRLRDASESPDDPLACRGPIRAAYQRGFLLYCAIPLVIASYCLTTAWAWHRNGAAEATPPGTLDALSSTPLPALGLFTLTGAGLHLIGWSVALLIVWWCGRQGQAVEAAPFSWRAHLGWELVLIALSGAMGGALLWAIVDATPSGTCTAESCLRVADFAEWYAAFAVPGFMGLFLLVATLFIGLTARWTGDDEHEFWGRTGAWMLSVGTVIGTLGAVIVFGPGLLAMLGLWIAASIGGGAGLLTLLGGFSAKTLLLEPSQQNRSSRLLELALRIATPLFIVMLIIGFAFVTSLLVTGLHAFGSEHPAQTWADVGQLMVDSGPARLHSLALHNASLLVLCVLWVGLLGLGLLMGFFININKFSLHGFYRNRLINAYLGASRDQTPTDRRRANPLTGFDDADNIPMTALAEQRPLHVVNIALNLVRGNKLSWQQRKAQSFTVSPLHCGSAQDIGYRRASIYGYSQAAQRAISLGTAMATSGAAASPNMGYHTSTPVAFLLAMFNLRLGWWMGNPGRAGAEGLLPGVRTPAYQRAHPEFSVLPMMKELFGFTNTNQRYVYLSDGGHFDNLGLYEMVLRRCRTIVVIDAGCDPSYSFEDMGNAIRKIRIDQGVDIVMPLESLRPIPSEGDTTGSASASWAIGTIHYERVDANGKPGALIYLKPRLCGKEPTDVQDYKARHQAFPHEPTSDQFFDEAQFESYRQLGFYMADAMLRQTAGQGAQQPAPADLLRGRLASHR